jgi:hypothetical protein
VFAKTHNVVKPLRVFPRPEESLSKNTNAPKRNVRSFVVGIMLSIRILCSIGAEIPPGMNTNVWLGVSQFCSKKRLTEVTVN